MLEYIMNNHLGSTLFYSDKITFSSKSNLSIIKSLCIDSCFTYEGYIKAVKKKLKFSYKIPIYINEFLCMIQTKSIRDYENIWINYAAITSLSSNDDVLFVEFISGRNLSVKISLYTIRKQIEQIEQIRRLK